MASEVKGLATQTAKAADAIDATIHKLAEIATLIAAKTPASTSRRRR